MLSSFINLLLAQVSWVTNDELSRPQCKTMPGDPSWPDVGVWNRFNASVDGHLIRTVPIASPCHGRNYDPKKCDFVRSQWHEPEFHEQYASSIMGPVFLNKSCDPFTKVYDQCINGAYVEYSVDVASPERVIKTLAFAKQHNIRFVVKNTGHDYQGKSTGAGGLAVWMHHLTGKEWIPHYNARDSTYRGPAVKVYAGVTGGELHREAGARGQVVVSGNCPSVGFTGGYIQGGGHSMLSSIYGMAADQALEFEVITTNGQFVRASPSENSELFWALRGGGGGAYGVVWSVTVKTYPDFLATTVHAFYRPRSLDKSGLDAYWKSIGLYFRESPKYLDAGAVYLHYFDNTFSRVFLVFPRKRVYEVDRLTQPWREGLTALNITLELLDIGLNPTFYQAYNELLDTFGDGMRAGMGLWGGRILPKRLYETNESLSTLVDTMREIVDDNVRILDHAFNPTNEVSGHPDNAIHPAFRSMHSSCALISDWNDTASWEEQFSKTKSITYWSNRLAEISPESGVYLNEGDVFDPNWKHNFYGKNYDRLLAIKNAWDPDQMLYGATGVGGDRWVTVEGGRLCPVAA